MRGISEAALVWDAMVYQIAKEAGAMADGAARQSGRTGADRRHGALRAVDRSGCARRSNGLRPSRVYPGEDELQALAEGVFRVLDGEEKAKHLWEEGRGPAEAAAPREALVLGIE